MAATLTEKISTGTTFTWAGGSAVAKIVDVSYGVENSAEDTTGQEDGRDRDFVAGLREVTLGMSLVWDALDTTHAAILTSFNAGTKATGVFTPPDGVAFTLDLVIEELGETQALGNVIKADVTFALNDRESLSVAGVR